MIKFVIISLLLSFLHTAVNAQSSKTEDVLYLKNKWVLRGTLTQQDSAGCTLQTRDGNIFVFTKNEIDKVARERAWHGFMYKTTGFANFTELGPLVAGKTTIEGVTTAAFSFQTVNGYKFSQFAMLGIGVGADLYATQTVLPVFTSLRGDLSKSGTVIPFYFGDAGYGINITQKSADANSFKGGLMYALGLGLKIPFNRSAGFLLSAGYRYQKTSYLLNTLPKEVTYNRVAIRAGFFL